MTICHPQSGSEARCPIAPTTRNRPSISTQAPKNRSNVAIVKPGYTNAITPKIIAAIPLITGTHQWRFKDSIIIAPFLRNGVREAKPPYGWIGCIESKPALRAGFRNAGARSKERRQIRIDEWDVVDPREII